MKLSAPLMFIGFAAIVSCCAVVAFCDIKSRKKWRIINTVTAVGGASLIIGALLTYQSL